MLTAWLRFFRVVNLPTVPGDVLVGAVAVFSGAGVIMDYSVPLCNASLAGICFYLFGLADNDIVGAAAGDRDRPIPEGKISLRAARIARFVCWAAAVALGFCPDPVFSGSRLPGAWWLSSAALLVAIVVYNRTKWWPLMGLCRGLNVLSGGLAAWPWLAECGFDLSRSRLPLAAVVAIWTLYIALVTRYSEGEEEDAAKRRRVGFLVGAIVYWQILALVWFHSGLAVLTLIAMVAVRVMKMSMKEVNAS